jgi:hypothetical protein
MTEEQIVALFDWYDFRDRIGNPLTQCEDFRQLILLARQTKKQGQP